MDERLRYFRTIVETRSISEAARKLRVSQPALSNALLKLEKELKQTLINRSHHRFEVTPAGWLTYEHALQQSSDRHAFTEKLKRLGGERSSVRIGLIDSIADIFCESDELLPALERNYQVSLTVDASSRLVEAVKRQEVDFALVAMASPVLNGSKLQRLPVGDEALLDVRSADAPLSRRLIAYNQGSATFVIIKSAFADVKRPFEPAMYSTSPETMLRLVRQGRGHAVLPYFMLQQDLADKRLIIAPVGRDGFARRTIGLIYNQRHESMQMIARTLGTILKQYESAAHKAVRPLFET